MVHIISYRGEKINSTPFPRKLIGEFRIGRPLAALSWLMAILIIALNGKLLTDFSISLF